MSSRQRKQELCSDYEDLCRLGHDAVQFRRQSPCFRATYCLNLQDIRRYLQRRRFPEPAGLIFRIRTVRKENYDIHDNSVADVGNRRSGTAGGNITAFWVLNYSSSQHTCKCSFCKVEHRQKAAILEYPLTL
jgi:hypothetical protein